MRSSADDPTAPPLEVRRIQELRFEGDAWCKVAWLDERAPLEPPWRPFEARYREALAAWRADPSEAAGQRLIELLVDDLLCEQLPESSAFAELERGPWVEVDARIARAEADGICARLGCEAGEQALAWFGALEPTRAWRCDHPSASAAAVLTPTIGAFYFDRG